MTVAYWCIFIAFLLPYFLVVAAKVNAPGMNNYAPRAALEKIDGWKQRANWAHQNAFEAFAPFASAVIIAQFVQVEQLYLNFIAILFVIARVLHGIFYIMDFAMARSISWAVGFIAIISIFIISAKA